MSFGAVIAVKRGFMFFRMDPDLESALTEIRVEQHLDEPTTFALRFQEDFEGDAPKLTEDSLFKAATELAILVPDGPDSKQLVCLVQGVVERVSFDIDIAGTGSAFDVIGQDVRMLLNRVAKPRSFASMSSDGIIRQLVGEVPELATMKLCIAPGAERYDANTGGPAAMNSVGTPLEVIEALATEENHCVWMSYSAAALGPAITLDTTLNVRPSPDRGLLIPGAIPALPRPAIKILVGPKQRANVTSLKIQSDNERIKVVHASAIDESGGGSSKVAARSTDDKLNPTGAGVEATGAQSERSAYCASVGGPTAITRKAEAMATAASWYIEAEAMTSASLYGAVLQPHEKLEVLGVGAEWAGEYQVRDVIHVINGAEHWMTATLRGNSRGKGTVP